MKQRSFLFGILLLGVVSCGFQPNITSLKSHGSIPSERQLAWHKLEYYAFIHFNMNTFTDMEWGMGNESPKRFNPTALDCEQWVKTIKNAGMKGVILTAKHHDGFCLWPSKYTEHSVKNSPWKNGKGDVVKELSEACKKYGIKFGVYLSPWDRNHAEYGQEAYITYFHNQLRELLTNYGEIFEVWFDGANGGSGYYGGANEIRKIDAETYYQWDKVIQIVRELQPNAVIFGEGKVDVRWVGNEEGVGGKVSWCPININEIPQGMTQNQHLSRGDANGKYWIPAEVDVSVRPGWYYHPREDHQVKTLQHLVDIYYNSVGRNASLLLNFPVDTRGLIHEKDAEQVLKLKKVIDEDFKNELAFGSNVEASSVFQNSKKLSATAVNDRNDQTFWMPEISDKTPHLTLQFEKETTFNRVLLQENIALGQRVKSYEIQALINNSWQKIYQGETIGYKTILRLPQTTTKEIRLKINEALAPPMMATMEIFNAPKLLVPPTFERRKNGEVSLHSFEKDVEIYYTLNGETPSKTSNKYTEYIDIQKPVFLKAITYDPKLDKYSDVFSQKISISKKDWKVIEVSSGDIQKAQNLIDENIISEFYTEKSSQNQFVTIDLGNNILLEGFSYMPPQARWAYGTIQKYHFFVSSDAENWQKVSEGEFQNVKNNPILQEKFFTPIYARYIKLVALEQVDGSKAAGFSEIGVIVKQ